MKRKEVMMTCGDAVPVGGVVKGLEALGTDLSSRGFASQTVIETCSETLGIALGTGNLQHPIMLAPALGAQR
jgi:hypothetical protein